MTELTLAQAEQYAASEGIRLTPSDLDAIRKLQQAEQQRQQALRTTLSRSGYFPRLIDGFNSLYPRFLEALNGIGDVLLSFTQTMTVAFGVPVVLLLLLIVEQQRVVHGILLFEADSALASFAAWALVILNLVLEVQVHYIEHREGYQAGEHHRFSLRLWLEDAAYTLGLGAEWQPRPLSPAYRYKGLLRLVTFSILSLALAGSMRTVIAATDGAWYMALSRIVSESNLSLMMTWVGGLLFAGAAVLSAQGLSRYVAIRTVEVLQRMASMHESSEEDFDESLDHVAAQYILAKVATVKGKRDAAEVALPHIPFSQNGKEHSPMG